MSDPRARLVSRTIFVTIGAVILTSLLLASRPQTLGDAVLTHVDGAVVAADMRAVVELLLDVYTDAIKLIASTFAATAFLLTMRREYNIPVTKAIWILLYGGVVLLATALFTCLASREVLLMMFARNAVDLTLPVLLYGRWVAYACLVIAALCVGMFALQVSSAPVPPPTRPSEQL